jgi:parvulin-like peptidyl-prolyl isomerase
MVKKGIVFALAVSLSSCSYFKEEQKPEAVARVNNSYLYKSDLEDLVPAGTSKEDSIAIVKSFIDRWASQTLLYDAAEVNLSQEKQDEYNELVRQYQVDLFTKAYIEELVKQRVDTAITDADLKNYYNSNKDNFKTTGMLVRLRYIHLANDNPRFGTIRQRFLSGNKKDLKALNDMSIQFKSFAFNDTTWVELNQVYRKLPFITPDNVGKYIGSGMSYQYPDSTGVYLVKVSRVLDKNQVAPYEYIKPTLEQLIINNRKLELIKKFEKEITDDAIKNDKYEIYK